MRCPKCKLKYPNDKQNRTYHPALFKAYIRQKGSNPLQHIGWYCIHCETLFSLNDGELPKEAVDEIFAILRENGASKIDLDYVDIKYNDLLKKCGKI